MLYRDLFAFKAMKGKEFTMKKTRLVSILLLCCVLFLCTFSLFGCEKDKEPTDGTTVATLAETQFITPTEADLPWEEKGAKQPKDYTWEEFDKLNQAQAEAFFESFESADAFKEWMAKAKGE